MVTMNRWVGYFSLVLWVTVFAASSGFGQTTFGSITGTVADPSGSAVPNAAVTVTNDAKGTTRKETTGSTGVFNVPNLDVGTYRLAITATGFETYERAGLDLTAHQVINLNVALVLGSTATVVNVVAASPIIDTSNATLSSVVTGFSMQELPLVSRQHGDAGFYDIMLLNPGTAQVPVNGAGPVINGTHQASGQLVAIDGIALWRNTSGYGAGEEQPSFEAAQEVHVITSDAPAEYASPVATTEVTKSGSNAFHGGAFEAYNSNILNARDFFATTAPTRVFNDFGATLGGPIRKNKTFFYFAFEGTRSGGPTPLTANVPPVAWRQGDFSSLSTVIKNPATGQPFQGNVIPSNIISSVSQKMDSTIYPLPNFGSPTLVSNNFRGNYPNVGTNNWDVYNGRVDHNFSSRDTIFGRFSTRKIPQNRTITLPTVGSGLQIRNGFSSVFSWTHIFSPTVFNEFRAGYIRGRNHFFLYANGGNLVEQFGLQGVPATGIPGAPVLSITSVTGLTSFTYQDTHEDNFQYIDDVVWNKGRHFMKFGFNAVRDRPGGLTIPSSVYGQYNFTGVYSGLGFADFLLGIPQSTSLTVPTPPRYLRGTVWGMYAQDQFKVNSRLTLNYGVRWDIEPPYTSTQGAIYSFNPANGDLVVPQNGVQAVNPLFPKNIPIETASQAGYPSGSMLDFHKDYILPRIGFAYSPTLAGKTVIRGGYGIYSNLPYANLAVGMTGGPFSGSTTYRNSLTNGVPLFSFPDPFLASGTTATQNVHGDNPSMRLPYTQQWNLTVERQIGGFAFQVAYVGTHAVDLYYERNLNQPIPSTTPFTASREAYPLYGVVNWVDSGGTVDFNSLDASVTKRYGKNLTFNSGWTWSRDLTDVGNSTSTAGYVIQNPYSLRAERGNDADTPATRWFGYALYALPFGQGQRFLGNANSVVQAFLGGWNTSWNAVVQSGAFFTPAFSGFDAANTGVFGGRPDRIGSGSLSSGRSVNNWFNASAFKIPGCPDAQPVCANPTNIGRFGNAGVDILTGPHIINFDFSLRKNFKIRENVFLEFRLNMVNALNHPNFSNPDPNISDLGTVGTISSTASATGLGEPVPREIDLWLRLTF